MDLVFPAEHGLLTAAGLPVAESHTQLAHTRPEPFSIYAGLRRWLADGWLMECQSTTAPTYGVMKSSASQNTAINRLQPIDISINNRLCSIEHTFNDRL